MVHKRLKPQDAANSFKFTISKSSRFFTYLNYYLDIWKIVPVKFKRINIVYLVIFNVFTAVLSLFKHILQYFFLLLKHSRNRSLLAIYAHSMRTMNSDMHAI